MRWLIGDIQGCAAQLDKLLAEIRFDPGGDELWSLGDLVNRGPDSAAALRLWRDAGGRGILGNHDVYALLAHSGRRKRHADTLDVLFDAPDCAELLDRVRRLELLVHLPAPAPEVAGVWIVHAGLHPAWTDLEATARRINVGPHDDGWLQSPDTALSTRIRCCTPDGRMVRHSGPPDACPPDSVPWDSLYRGPSLVIHGHWARRGYYRTEYTMGLDSGCVYGGWLTAWCHEEDRIVQIPGPAGRATTGGTGR